MSGLTADGPKYPFTSIKMSACPYTYTHTSPADDTGEITAFATVEPDTKFKLDTSGNEPHGYTDT